MLTQTIFTTGALLAMVAAVPLQQQNKREYIYETKTIEEVTTVDVTTTVWLSPGETPPAHYGHGHHKHTSHITSTVTVPAASAAPASSPPEESTYVAPSPSSPAASPTTSAYVATTSQAPPPARSPAPSPSSGSDSSSSGQTYSGDITYYSPGLGSCGKTNTDSDYIVALAEDMMTAALGSLGNPNLNPLCGKSITISYGGKTAVATIMDTCPGCSGASLDLTPTLFEQFAQLSTGRVSGVDWWYN